MDTGGFTRSCSDSLGIKETKKTLTEKEGSAGQFLARVSLGRQTARPRMHDKQRCPSWTDAAQFGLSSYPWVVHLGAYGRLGVWGWPGVGVFRSKCIWTYRLPMDVCMAMGIHMWRPPGRLIRCVRRGTSATKGTKAKHVCQCNPSVHDGCITLYLPS